MFYKRIVAVVLCAVVQAAFAAKPAFFCGPDSAGASCQLLEVSMIELLASPEKFHKKHVRVSGYLNLEFEGNGLYLHKEDYENGLYRNGVWLSLTKGWHGGSEPCNSKTYALIEGVFNAEQFGHMGVWSGSLESVTRCISRGSP